MFHPERRRSRTGRSRGGCRRGGGGGCRGGCRRSRSSRGSRSGRSRSCGGCRRGRGLNGEFSLDNITALNAICRRCHSRRRSVNVDVKAGKATREGAAIACSRTGRSGGRGGSRSRSSGRCSGCRTGLDEECSADKGHRLEPRSARLAERCVSGRQTARNEARGKGGRRQKVSLLQPRRPKRRSWWQPVPQQRPS